MNLSLIIILIVLGQENAATESGGEGPELEEIQKKIQNVDYDLKRLEDRLNAIRSDSQKVSDEIGRLELQKAVITGKIEKHELQLAEATKQLSLNEAKQKELEESAARQQRELSTRLRKLYKRGSLGYTKLFLKQSRLSELITAYHYAQILTERDQEALRSYRQILSQMRIVEETLARIQADAETTRGNLAGEKADLDRLLSRRAVRLREIRKKASSQERLYQDLELEKEEMEMMVRRLTEADSDPMELQISITRYKGKLAWPAKGRLTRKFGIYRDPEFKTKRKQNGIDIMLPKGSEIKAVYSGKVLYADWFKSYGNLVIVDHNDRIISFYAHCDRLLVRKGDFVEKASVIALSGDTGSLDGPLLHFEIRNKTQPEDPLKWLR